MTNLENEISNTAKHSHSRIRGKITTLVVLGALTLGTGYMFVDYALEQAAIEKKSATEKKIKEEEAATKQKKAEELMKAQEVLKNGIQNDSITLINRALEMSQHHYDFYCSIGDYYFKKENNQLAEEHYEKAIKKNPGASYGYYGTGICCMVNAYHWEGRTARRFLDVLNVDGVYQGDQIVVTSQSWYSDWKKLALENLKKAYETESNSRFREIIAENIGLLENSPEKEHRRFYLDGSIGRFSLLSMRGVK